MLQLGSGSGKADPGLAIVWQRMVMYQQELMQKVDARIIIAGAHPKGPIDHLIILSSWIEVHIVVVPL